LRKGAGTVTDRPISEVIVAPDREAEYRRPRRCLFGSVLLLWFAIGAVDGLTDADPSGEGFWFAFWIFNSLLLTLWCSTDGKARGIHLFHAWELFVFFGWPVAVPTYLLWSRGLRGIGNALLFYLLLYTLPAFGAYAGYFLQCLAYLIG
jgi:hypothetical protein